MSAPARFKQIDVQRAVRGAIDAGMRVGQVIIEPGGNIVIMSEGAAPAARRNPWDGLLKP
jgi:hypothetical protein